MATKDKPKAIALRYSPSEFSGSEKRVAKYAHRYLAEVQYRFNRRFDLASMVPRFITAIMQTARCSRRQIQYVAEIGT